MRSSDIEASRVQDLLVQRASEGLTDSQARELDELGGTDISSFDLAAAMIDVAMCAAETMPDAVADRVLAAARSSRPAAFTAPALPAIAASMTIRAVPETRAAHPSRRRGYLISAALAATLVAGLGIGRISNQSRAPAPSVAPAFDAAGDDLVTQLSGTGITGSVRWSSARQRGLLEIHGLPINDPSQARFQIWIVDRDRDRRYPVDAGLFDVGGPDVSVAFHTHVRVGTAIELFVTKETPEGVVVSDRSEVVARARLDLTRH